MRAKHVRAVLPLFIFVVVCRAAEAKAEVKAWEEPVTIPTYLIAAPDPNPQFYFGRASQGAQQRIYPYPVYDNLTNNKVDKTYKMIYLENEYLKIGVLPEIGGKIFEAIDKTNGYNFFYHQHVIKPALISLLGAWISGGVEWNIPHHHRATSFLPVQYRIENQTDGSKTVWVGELELRQRMRWAVGMTLHPGKSYLEVSFRIVNQTPVVNTMLCFANCAVSVNDNYQVIFPPSTQHVTYHFKRDFTTWPIATTRFAGADFTGGVDVSWYKNLVGSTSMFAWNYQDDFFAGYDHGKQAGTMSIADHHIVPGKKFFTWGTGPRGQAENAMLTDSDGPYIELMAGAYSDNQPDYSWLQPYEVKSWTQYWYPFRDIDGVKNANLDAAVNLDVKDGQAKLGFCATSEHPAATISLKLKDQVLLSEQTVIGPDKPYLKTISLPAGADEHDLRASLSVGGKELVAYSPVRLAPEAMPSPVTNPTPPDQIKSNEELYLTGLRIEQFHSATQKPGPYWDEALRRDPGDVRVNTAMGIDFIKSAQYADAEKVLRKALERATAQYTSPKDGEPFYYLGLALKGEGKLDEAYTEFYKATWSEAWRAPAYFNLAEIATTRGDFAAAGDFIDRSLDANGMNIRALTLKSAILRNTGHEDQAMALAGAFNKTDPLDAGAMAEIWLANKSEDAGNSLSAVLRDYPTNALEAACEYMNAGLWSDGASLLKQAIAASEPSKVSPLVYYYLAYFSQKMGQYGQAAEYDRLAQQAPSDYVFPFQSEAIDVLQAAMTADPSDSHAPYYLGNLLFDWQPDRAAALWQKSADMGTAIPIAYRNLATVETRQGNSRDQAIANLEKAISLGGTAMDFYELDQLYEEAAVSPQKRLAIMEQHQNLIDRDDTISREINLKIFAGEYDDAIGYMTSRSFHVWEGGPRYSVGDSWTNAMLLRGQRRLAGHEFPAALADFQAAMKLPANLLETSLPAARQPEADYWIGMAYDAMGNPDKARQAWNDATTARTQSANGLGGRGGRGGAIGSGIRVAGAAPYYQALSFQKLGQPEKAQAIFKLLASTSIPADPARAADAHYLAGLGHLGLNETDAAQREFKLALASTPDHLAASVALSQIAK